ncbi:hypothetical protein WMF28_30435 [Sorangium sp. So ce590]
MNGIVLPFSHLCISIHPGKAQADLVNSTSGMQLTEAGGSF